MPEARSQKPEARPFDSNERPGISADELALLNAVLAENGSTAEARSAIGHHFIRGIFPDALRRAVNAELNPPKPEAATVSPGQFDPIVKTGTSGAGKSQASSRSKTRGKKA